MGENLLVMTVVVGRDGGVTPVMNLGQGGDVVGDLVLALRALGVVSDNLREALVGEVGRLEHEGAKGREGREARRHEGEKGRGGEGEMGRVGRVGRVGKMGDGEEGGR